MRPQDATSATATAGPLQHFRSYAVEQLRKSTGEEAMNLRWGLLVAAAIAIPTSGALANDELMKLEKDPNQWVMPTGDYANHRYSQLKQITKENVKNLRAVWTFSTGVLRGHEGAPLVIGNVMYVHTPFPNNVFALDLDHDGKILWKY